MLTCLRSTRTAAPERLVFLCLVLGLAGCADDDKPHDHHHPHPGHGPMACKGDEDPHAPGAQKQGESKVFSVEVVRAEPAKHRVAGDNKLTLKVLDAMGKPVDGASVGAEVWTPSHGGHTADVQPSVKAGNAAGEHELTGISYVHSGPWELRLDINKGGDSDKVTLVLCVADSGHTGHDAGMDAGPHVMDAGPGAMDGRVVAADSGVSDAARD